eukprot:TRINITY_DN42306_c0_g1_i2.p2 TRINITY_DN42306_c0_g1~~TRINITY_DN42306_c0_g1_i2.p2  ORF type:complete len:132 (-),score=0.09 TRINITY_DN42306_c0_g1_i2:68-463(-)
MDDMLNYVKFVQIIFFNQGQYSGLNSTHVWDHYLLTGLRLLFQNFFFVFVFRFFIFFWGLLGCKHNTWSLYELQWLQHQTSINLACYFQVFIQRQEIQVTDLQNLLGRFYFRKNLFDEREQIERMREQNQE